MQLTTTFAILDQLAKEQRVVLSDWRGLVLLRRATFSVPEQGRRWSQIPNQITDMTPLYRQMQQRSEIRLLRGLHGVYQVIVPYARQEAVDEREILFEVNPYSVLSHASALTFHALTEEFLKELTVTVPRNSFGEMLPLGTNANDWEGLDLPIGRKPPKVMGRSITWIKVNPDRLFGFGVYQPRSFPLRVTTIERTLIDSVQSPELSGGVANVFRAWKNAKYLINTDAMIHQVERLSINILKQRIGYLLETLSLEHPRLEKWQLDSRRGGSSRMIASAPYSPLYSERWNISLNAPTELLTEDL